jgi:dihydroflavonol-4-reductase
MKVLVTGASGFVGGAVARTLVQAGIDVRVLARPGSDPQNYARLNVETVEGELRDPNSLRRALTGCRQLYHVAAHYALWAKDPAIFYDVNVTGTRTLLEIARDVGTERIVYCSTIGAIGLPPGGGLGTEDTPVSLDQMAGHYKRSKYLAEQEVLKLAREGLPVVIVPATSGQPRRDRSSSIS